ncbi:hypothetical protein GCM10009621_15810 [Corynebacterium felinum]
MASEVFSPEKTFVKPQLVVRGVGWVEYQGHARGRGCIQRGWVCEYRADLECVRTYLALFLVGAWGLCCV